jgi:hypothetical protein
MAGAASTGRLRSDGDCPNSLTRRPARPTLLTTLQSSDRAHALDYLLPTTPALTLTHHSPSSLVFPCAEKVVLKRQPVGPRSTGLISAPKVESLHALPFVQLYQ